MNTKRIRRQQSARVDETIITEELTFVDGNPVLSGRIETPVKVHPEHSHASEMTDSAVGEYRFKPVEHVHLHAQYNTPDPDPPHQLGPIYTYVSGPEGLYRKNQVPCSAIIEAARQQYRHDFNNSFPKERVDRWFADPNLPTSIRINRDPFDSQFSIWFLVADIITLPKLALQIFSRTLVRRPDLASGRTLKQLGDDDLARRFGVEALYRDFAEFIDTCKRFIDGIDKFNEVYKEKFTWHSHETECEENVPDALDTDFKPVSLFGAGGIHVAYFRNLVTCRFRRALRYRLRCPELTQWLDRFKQFIDVFGLLDPAAIWDVIPWSFAVDWFLPIGRWLHNNRPRLFPAEFEILDYCESIRVEQLNEFVAVPAFGMYHLGTPTIKPIPMGGLEWQIFGATIGQERLVTYVRRVFEPDAKNINQTSRSPLLRWRNVAVAASLSAQRVPRPGVVGDEFEGVDYGAEGLILTPVDVKEADANRRWAETMRSRKAAALGVNKALWRFELGTRKTNPTLDSFRSPRDTRHRLGTVVVLEDFRLMKQRVEAQVEKFALQGVAQQAQQNWVRNRASSHAVLVPRP